MVYAASNPWAVHPHACGEHVRAALDSARLALERNLGKDRGDAVHATIGEPDGRDWWMVRRLPWDDVDGSEEGAALRRAALTRKGEPTVTVVPLFVHDDRWTLDRAGATPAPSGVIDFEGAKLLQRRAVRVARYELVKALAGKSGPPGWEEHPLTRGLKPLELQGGVARFGETEAVLDEELGLVYRRFDTSSP